MVHTELELLYMIGYIDMEAMLKLEMEELAAGPTFRGAKPIESLGVLWSNQVYHRTARGLPGAVLDVSVGRLGNSEEY